MSLMDRSIMIHIDSHDRISGTHQSGQYNIITQINNGHITDYDTVVCMSVSLAKSWYAVEEGFNTFQVRDTLATGYYEVILQPGTYSAKQFRSALEDAMNLASSTNGDSWAYLVCFCSFRAKYVYTVSGNSEQPQIKTTINVYEQLGFEPKSENNFIGDTLESTSVINMSPENNIMLRSSLCEGGNNNENILQDLHMSQVPPFGYMQFYQHDTEAYSKSLNTHSTIINISLTNEDTEASGLQREVQINNINWVANILLYKKSTLSELIKKDIKLNAMREFNENLTK